MLPAACETVGLLQDVLLEPGNARLDLVLVMVWWGIGLESEERRGENRGPATTSAAIGLRTLSFGDLLQGTPWQMVGTRSRSTAEL